MRDLDERMQALSRSRFRRRFRLDSTELQYLRRKSKQTILEHGRRFIDERLGAAVPSEDGRQTPMRGHPIFVAQHATATCCRGCLAKWHGVAKGKPLQPEQIQYILDLWDRWLTDQLAAAESSSERDSMAVRQGTLFPLDS